MTSDDDFGAEYRRKEVRRLGDQLARAAALLRDSHPAPWLTIKQQGSWYAERERLGIYPSHDSRSKGNLGT